MLLTIFYCALATCSALAGDDDQPVKPSAKVLSLKKSDPYLYRFLIKAPTGSTAQIRIDDQATADFLLDEPLTFNEDDDESDLFYDPYDDIFIDTEKEVWRLVGYRFKCSEKAVYDWDATITLPDGTEQFFGDRFRVKGCERQTKYIRRESVLKEFASNTYYSDCDPAGKRRFGRAKAWICVFGWWSDYGLLKECAAAYRISYSQTFRNGFKIKSGWKKQRLTKTFCKDHL